MEYIKKGTKAKINGWIISDEEKKEYQKMKENIKLFKKKYGEYKELYHDSI